MHVSSLGKVLTFVPMDRAEGFSLNSDSLAAKLANLRDMSADV